MVFLEQSGGLKKTMMTPMISHDPLSAGGQFLLWFCGGAYFSISIPGAPDLGSMSRFVLLENGRLPLALVDIREQPHFAALLEVRRLQEECSLA